jgi:TRAP-type C4-dicarboxylate transport system permease small subunit
MTENFRAMLARLEWFGKMVENVALVALLGGMMLLAVAQIVMREVFNSGVAWGGEVLKLMVLWLAMIAAIAACRDNRHIRVDAISHLLPDTAIRVTRVIVDVFAAVVCCVVAWQAWRYLQLEIEFEDTVVINTPAWLVHSIVPIGFAVTGYRFLVGAVRTAFGVDAAVERGAVL